MLNLCLNIGFSEENIQFIPYSGYTGHHLVNRYEDFSKDKINKMEWYKGKTLLESLDEIKPVKRDFDSQLIISIFEAYTILGVGIIISSMTTKYRDLSILVGFGIQLWMYGTPVVYPLSQLPQGWMRTLSLMNPVTAPMELFRLILLGEGLFVPLSYVWSLAFTVLVTVFGVVVFNWVEKTFLDTV